MKMRENIARAIRDSLPAWPLENYPRSQDGFIIYSPIGPLDCLVAACAALDALLGPTDGMTDAALAVADATVGRDTFMAHVRAARDGQ